MMPLRLDRKTVKEVSGKSSSEFPTVTALDVSNRSLSEVVSLQYLPALARLDVSRNQLQSLGGISDCTTLRWLNLSNNQLTSLEPLSALNNLQVLNVSNNQIAGKLKLEGLPSLCALIASNNAIVGLKSLGESSRLNTLVLKSNRISSLGKALQPCTSLAKLSIAHNQLTDLGYSLATCHQLAELRVSHNQLGTLPDQLSQNARLKIVELGSNLIETVSAVSVLQKLPHLISCSLKGCPAAEASDYLQQMLSLLPGLQILDSQKLKQHRSRQDLAPQDIPTNSKKPKKAAVVESQLEKGSKQQVEETAVPKATKRQRLPDSLGLPVDSSSQGLVPMTATGMEEATAPLKKKSKTRKQERQTKRPSPEKLHTVEDQDLPPAGAAEPDPISITAIQQKTEMDHKGSRKPKRVITASKAEMEPGSGANIGAALQMGLLGTALEPDLPLAPAWD